MGLGMSVLSESLPMVCAALAVVGCRLWATERMAERRGRFPRSMTVKCRNIQ